jgi:hypothetical protein
MPSQSDPQAAERDNFAQIRRLNQRGGRTLSVVDLAERGTMPPEMAAFCWLMLERGASLLTGAVPGGVGKTTLMAALLAFLPLGERIVTVEDAAVIARAQRGSPEPPATVLAHEIGPGHWFGYIWGRQAADFFGLWRRGLRRVSCLHTDEPEQTREALTAIGVTDEDLRHVDLQLYMRAERSAVGLLRRVSELHCHAGGRLRCLWRWDAAQDAFEPGVEREEVCRLLGEGSDAGPAEFAARWRGRQGSIEGLCAEEVRDFQDVRRRVLASRRG